MLWLVYLLSVSTLALATEWIDYPADGTATLTHYTLPDGYIASCGCTGDSTRYPTVAMSQFAYGSSTAYGPGCGRCFKITLLNTYTASPPFIPNVTKSVVVKVTDLCPVGGAGWCSATPGKPNQYVLFEVTVASSVCYRCMEGVVNTSTSTLHGLRLPYRMTSFPLTRRSMVSLTLAYVVKWTDTPLHRLYRESNNLPMCKFLLSHDYQDFGVWNVTYQTVDCLENWAGAKKASALGSVDDGSSVCCPANPTV